MNSHYHKSTFTERSVLIYSICTLRFYPVSLVKTTMGKAPN